MQISNSFSCRRMSDLSLVSARANQCWCQSSAVQWGFYPIQGLAQKELREQENKCNACKERVFAFGNPGCHMLHPTKYIRLLFHIISTIVWLWYIDVAVQQIEWDFEAGLDRHKLRVFSLYSHKTNFCPFCASIREIVHGIDLITCSKRTRIALDIRLARNMSMQKGSCSFTWANEIVFLFAVPAEWCTI